MSFVRIYIIPIETNGQLTVGHIHGLKQLPFPFFALNIDPCIATLCPFKSLVMAYTVEPISDGISWDQLFFCCRCEIDLHTSKVFSKKNAISDELRVHSKKLSFCL